MSNSQSKFTRGLNGEYLCGMDNPDNYGYQPVRKDTEIARHHEKSFTERMRDWIDNREEGAFDRARSFISFIFALFIIFAMLLTVSYLPSFGDPDNPVNNEVSRRYIEKGLEETGGVNIVGGMILDYRAFDTLGESHVLFIAVSAVLILLRNDRKKKGKSLDDKIYEPHVDPILRKVAKLQIPCVLMFGIYIIMNGHISPGIRLGSYEPVLYLPHLPQGYRVRSRVLRICQMLCVLYRRQRTGNAHSPWEAWRHPQFRADPAAEHCRRTDRVLHHVRFLFTVY